MRSFLCRLAPLGLLLGAACHSNDLSGSVQEMFSLNFSHVRITYENKFLFIAYENGDETPCKMSVDNTALDLRDGVSVTEQFATRVGFTRQAADGLSYARVLNGKLTFDTVSPQAGARVHGAFNTVFSDGHTLVGDFDEKIAEVR